MREQRGDAGLSWAQCGGHPGGRGDLELGEEDYIGGKDGETPGGRQDNEPWAWMPSP